MNMRPLKKEKVNFNDKIVLKGHLTTRTSANTDVWWESVQYEGITLLRPALSLCNF